MVKKKGLSEFVCFVTSCFCIKKVAIQQPTLNCQIFDYCPKCTKLLFKGDKMHFSNLCKFIFVAADRHWPIKLIHSLSNKTGPTYLHLLTHSWPHLCHGCSNVTHHGKMQVSNLQRLLLLQVPYLTKEQQNAHISLHSQSAWAPQLSSSGHHPSTLWQKGSRWKVFCCEFWRSCYLNYSFLHEHANYLKRFKFLRTPHQSVDLTKLLGCVME